MSRRREVPKRKITPDPKYRDKLVAKFINSLMVGGKKSTAEGILYGAFDIISERFKEEPRTRVHHHSQEAQLSAS